MRTDLLLSALAAVSAVQAGPAKKRQSSLTPITVKGNAFFQGDKRFYVRGIDYQPGASSGNIDPLANTKICLPDIEKFKKLGINVVRVYSTDNTMDHKECMDALAEAGIYAALDVNNPKYSINRESPGPSYNEDYLQSVFATIDEFAKYDNTFVFFSGNEVIHDDPDNTKAARYVKAVTRDMKAYMKARGHRAVPVGYSAADVSQNRMQTADYFNCGSDAARSDFFAFNDYSWCSSDFKRSGWDQKVKNFTGYGLPIFLSEYGCIDNTRDFGEIKALMSKDMTHVYSGGLMYEYSMEENDYGIVEISGKDQTGPRKELPEFAAMVKAMKDYPAPSDDGGYTSTQNSRPCPTPDDNWKVTLKGLPAMPTAAKAYFEDGAGKGPGLDGEGSHWEGDWELPDEDGSAEESEAGSGNENEDPDSAAMRFGKVDLAPLAISGLVALFTLAGAVTL